MVDHLVLLPTQCSLTACLLCRGFEPSNSAGPPLFWTIARCPHVQTQRWEVRASIVLLIPVTCTSRQACSANATRP